MTKSVYVHLGKGEWRGRGFEPMPDVTGREGGGEVTPLAMTTGGGVEGRGW
jgi:hypothetical protein